MTDIDFPRNRALNEILKRAGAAASEMEVSRGTLLLMLAVGALSAEGFEEDQIKTAVDFISAGLAMQMADIDFQS